MKKIANIVFTLSRLANANEEEAKKLVKKYSNMTEIEIMKDLSIYSFKAFSKNEGFFNYALTLIRSINPKKCPSIVEMKKILKQMHNVSIEDNRDLEENHKLVKENIDNFTTLFNEAGIDYYIVGALPCFIKIGQPLFRYHDDLDIMINEEDIEKARELVEICGFYFQDDRYPTVERYKEMERNKPPHTIMAQHPENEFHLGFFCFKREKNQSITMREYSHHIENNKVIVDVLERRSTPEGTKLRYDDIPIEFMHTTFKTSTLEGVYHIKSCTKRPKDIGDMKILETYIDKEKLELIERNPQVQVTLSNITSQEIINGIKRI